MVAYFWIPLQNKTGIKEKLRRAKGEEL